MRSFKAMLNITLWTILAVATAIVKCCLRGRCCETPAPTATITTTSSTTPTTVPYESSSSQQQQEHQHHAARADGIDPLLLRSKVIESMFPGQTVRCLYMSLTLYMTMFLRSHRRNTTQHNTTYVLGG